MLPLNFDKASDKYRDANARSRMKQFPMKWSNPSLWNSILEDLRNTIITNQSLFLKAFLETVLLIKEIFF